jgi:hypothetical protein
LFRECACRVSIYEQALTNVDSLGGSDASRELGTGRGAGTPNANMPSIQNA